MPTAPAPTIAILVDVDLVCRFSVIRAVPSIPVRPPPVWSPGPTHPRSHGKFGSLVLHRHAGPVRRL